MGSGSSCFAPRYMQQLLLPAMAACMFAAEARLSASHRSCDPCEVCHPASVEKSHGQEIRPYVTPVPTGIQYLMPVSLAFGEPKPGISPVSLYPSPADCLSSQETLSLPQTPRKRSFSSPTTQCAGSKAAVHLLDCRACACRKHLSWHISSSLYSVKGSVGWF
jgi:hypothetical protein